MSVWYDAWQGRPGCNGLGFGDDIGCAPTLGSFGHTPAKAISLGAEAWQRFDRLLLGVSGGSVLAAVGAAPTASSTYTLAKELGGDSQLMAEIVSLQTLAGAMSLPLWIWIAGIVAAP